MAWQHTKHRTEAAYVVVVGSEQLQVVDMLSGFDGLGTGRPNRKKNNNWAWVISEFNGLNHEKFRF
ncbi:hypothetical protein HS088_TW23G00274 [Tripterygium wilfordii]|uniref:Uncharacterized protein n=1 Tax=Tripterygium wilfordii TaxID=458696 RepID=A0A7J7BUF6_TRIWF|nr:hypothetical protein HS088_TW23G00274 [Tripterygium wilfordii]